jgi:hypothetical protein
MLESLHATEASAAVAAVPAIVSERSCSMASSLWKLSPHLPAIPRDRPRRGDDTPQPVAEQRRDHFVTIYP